MANSGLRLGNTSAANCVEDSICEIANMFGKIYGNRWVSFICASVSASEEQRSAESLYLLKERG